MKANKKTGLTREAIKEFNESRKGLEVDLMDEVLKSRVPPGWSPPVQRW